VGSGEASPHPWSFVTISGSSQRRGHPICAAPSIGRNCDLSAEGSTCCEPWERHPVCQVFLDSRAECGRAADDHRRAGSSTCRGREGEGREFCVMSIEAPAKEARLWTASPLPGARDNGAMVARGQLGSGGGHTSQNADGEARSVTVMLKPRFRPSTFFAERLQRALHTRAQSQPQPMGSKCSTGRESSPALGATHCR
jgi:hypothetical protein